MFPRIQNETLKKECIWVRIRGAFLAKKGGGRQSLVFIVKGGGQLPPFAPPPNPPPERRTLGILDGLKREFLYLDFGKAITDKSCNS